MDENISKIKSKIAVFDVVSMSLRSLLNNKIRSALTVLGIVIGVGSIMIVMSIGNAAKTLILQEVQSFGARNVFINPGRPEGGNPMAMAGSVLNNSLRERDIKQLERKDNVPDALFVNPSVTGSVSVSYADKSVIETIIGSGAYVFEVYNMDIVQGRPFTQDDINIKARVLIIGKNVAQDLFGASNPVGEKVLIKNQKFTIIGISSSENSSLLGIDDMIIAPYSSAQKYLLGDIKHFHEVVVQASTVEAVPSMVQDIKETLRESHNITDPSKDDFMVTTQADMMRSINSVLGALTAFLAIVAAISLLVGGVGVMNIMFVSVTERTKEIGLRKALGATQKSILLQFLFEAIFLTIGGGVIGVLFGIGITAAVVFTATKLTGTIFPFVISWIGMALGIIVSMGIGLVFGIFPARQASLKSPIEALRYE